MSIRRLCGVSKVLLLGCLLSWASSLMAAEPAAARPPAPPAGKSYRIAYFEGGDFWIFNRTMEATQKALEEYGWSKAIKFPSELRFSPGWDRPDDWKKVARDLMERKDVDLIIAAGSDATKALLAVNNQKTPVISIAVSDALKSKFVLNEKDSGIDNYTVRIVPNQYKRMFVLFHDVVGFKKLGIMYSNTETGQAFANLSDARQVAQERGFELVEYNQLSTNESVPECLEGIKALVKQGIDAFYLSSLLCLDWTKSDAKQVIELLSNDKIPTFAREGTDYVKAGALMGFSSIDFGPRGRFTADKIARIFLGTQPRKLEMIDNSSPKISLNVAVAKKIGFDPPVDIMLASDEIFQEITLPEKRLVK